MWQLLPEVEHLLIFRVALLEKHINDRQLLNIALSLKLLTDLCTDGGQRDVEGVGSGYFRGLDNALAYVWAEWAV